MSALYKPITDMARGDVFLKIQGASRKLGLVTYKEPECRQSGYTFWILDDGTKSKSHPANSCESCAILLDHIEIDEENPLYSLLKWADNNSQ